MVNYEYPPVGGGGGVAAANLAAELVKRGHEVDYITTLYPNFKRQEVIDGVHIYREPVPARKDLHTASIISMLAYPTVAIWRGLQLAKRHKYDVVHTHFAIPSGPAGYVLSKKLRLPHILSVYGGDIYDPSKSYSPHRHPVLKRAVKAILNQADAIVGESSDICKRAEQYYSPRTRPVRIPLGFTPPPEVQVRSREEMGMDANLVYAIAVSRLIVRKDYPTLLKAFAKLTAPDLRLLVTGEGPELPRLENLVASLGIKDRVKFLGALDDTSKFAYLHAADIFVLTPLHEGYGIVFQEAMYCGLPIVTTNNGGQTDFLVSGRNAVLAHVGDTDAVATGLNELYKNSELRAEMRRNNTGDIESQLISSVTKDYEHLFEQCMSSSNFTESHAASARR